MHIWTLDLDEEALPKELLEKCRASLSIQERNRADRFVRNSDQNRFVVAHALCRTMLSAYGEGAPDAWCFGAESLGRPFIDPSMNSNNIDFNMSHTVNQVGCAIGLNRRVSLDLEKRSRQAPFEQLARKQFSLLEQEQFFAEPASVRPNKFFQFWTLKEAYIKITGKGLSESLSSFSFDLSGTSPRLFSGGEELTEYSFGLFDLSDTHQGAWAVEVKEESVEVKEVALVTGGSTVAPEISRLTLGCIERRLLC